MRSRPLLADVVRAELSRAIISGQFPPGSKLPNEEQLRERFDVSRITLREAVQGLIQDGYVVRRQGSGTYVTRRPTLRNSLDTNFSYTEYLSQKGGQAGRKVISARTVAADDEVAEALAIEPETPLVELRRVRTAGRRPAIYSVDYLPADIVDLARDRKALGGSTYRLMTRLGHPIDHGEATIAPAAADDQLSQLLHVPEDSLLLHLRQIDFDPADRPVMFSLEWHVPSVIEVSVYRRGPGPLDD